MWPAPPSSCSVPTWQKKSHRTSLTALLPPRILTGSQNAITRKSLIYQAFSDDGLLYSRRVLTPSSSPAALLSKLFWRFFDNLKNRCACRHSGFDFSDLFIRRQGIGRPHMRSSSPPPAAQRPCCPAPGGPGRPWSRCPPPGWQESPRNK